MKKLLFLLFILNSCATFKNEKELYAEIQQSVDQQHYNRAILESMAFERNFPDSLKLCELWQLQLDLNKNTDRLAEKYIEQLKIKLKERCK